ncbi:MAG: DUF72 domain-containing protein [Nitrososphaeria archaeon]|nr:DUF72 domain-containing protein [Nitrososphaeria archaeon]
MFLIESLGQKILIGTSGWDYEDWVGPFYNSNEKKLLVYSQIFKTVEIDSTFYSFPTPNFIKGISRTVPKDFKFSVKLPKDITHKKLLDVKKGALDDLNRFLHVLIPLENEDKLGALLIQMPPKGKHEIFENFKDFISNIDVERYDFVAEFRDKSWLDDEVLKLLSKYKVAFCIVDEPLLPPLLEITGRVAYVRWHGRGNRPWYYYEYREEELIEWIPRLEQVANNVEVLYGYFNNHFRGFAPKNALQMLKLLGIANSIQKERLQKVVDYFEKEFVRYIKARGPDIISKGDFSLMLSLFIDKKRLERANEDKDKVKIFEIGNEIIRGTVKDYKIEISLSDKSISHDCEDWRKRASAKQFCKHIGSIFLYLPKEVSFNLLNDIIKNIDEWNFKVP